jgi:DNA polymerase-1
MKTIGLDFEFFDSNEKDMKVIAAVVCTSEETFKFDLTNQMQVIGLKNCLQQHKDCIFLAYAAIAEARALLSLGIDPLQFTWIDLYVEFRMLCNSNNRWNYGNYIPKTGGVGYSTPPNPLLSEEEKENDYENHEETPKNLINAVYKLIGGRLDQKEKDTMRELILSKDLVNIHAHMDEILDYCASDTKYLRALDIAIQRQYVQEGIEDFRKDQNDRGKYAVCTAYCERDGMPINIDLLQKIIDKTPEILNMHKDAVNEHFNYFVPEIQRPPIKRKNGTMFHYKLTPAKKDTNAYQRYVETLKIPNFPTTKTGKYKSDKDTLEEFGYWGGLEELWKYNKTEASLKWFNKENGNGFFERLGSDKAIRPYYGIFGTQTGRNAAKAKTFPLAMSSWLRAIVQPKRGSSIIGADFSQQEVLVAAILSGDKNMLNAYNSGDVYLEFAKQANLVPQDATKQSHKKERDLCKSTILGLNFGMGINKLQTKLKLDSGREVSREETEILVKAHKETYNTYWEWVYEVTNDYKDKNPLCTNDGWVLFCDNPSIPSIRNFLVQGNAASITRRAIVLMVESGMQVMCGLHDAVYVISENPEQDSKLVEKLMLKATCDILKTTTTSMRVDIKIVSHDEIWVEDKSLKDINKLAPFLGIKKDDNGKYTIEGAQ